MGMKKIPDILAEFWVFPATDTKSFSMVFEQFRRHSQQRLTPFPAPPPPPPLLLTLPAHQSSLVVRQQNRLNPALWL